MKYFIIFISIIFLATLAVRLLCVYELQINAFIRLYFYIKIFKISLNIFRKGKSRLYLMNIMQSQRMVILFHFCNCIIVANFSPVYERASPGWCDR